jgi:predicted DNA-binding protein
MKKLPPSKIRYEKDHPLLAFRVDLNLKQRVRRYLQQRGISGAEFIREALERLEKGHKPT